MAAEDEMLATDLMLLQQVIVSKRQSLTTEEFVLWHKSTPVMEARMKCIKLVSNKTRGQKLNQTVGSMILARKFGNGKLNKFETWMRGMLHILSR